MIYLLGLAFCSLTTVTGPPDVAPVDPPSIDWDAFMEDFDWNFDPNLLSTVVTV